MNPDGMVYMPLMYTQQNLVPLCNDSPEGEGASLQDSGASNKQATDTAAPRADIAAPRADTSAPRADTAAPRADTADAPTDCSASEAAGNTFTKIKVQYISKIKGGYIIRRTLVIHLDFSIIYLYFLNNPI